MPDFDKIFSTSDERSVSYRGKSLVRYDDFPFEDGDRFLIKFEKTNSEWIQGIGLSVFGFIEIESIKKIVNDRTFFLKILPLRRFL